MSVRALSAGHAFSLNAIERILAGGECGGCQSSSNGVRRAHMRAVQASPTGTPTPRLSPMLEDETAAEATVDAAQEGSNGIDAGVDSAADAGDDWDAEDVGDVDASDFDAVTLAVPSSASIALRSPYGIPLVASLGGVSVGTQRMLPCGPLGYGNPLRTAALLPMPEAIACRPSRGVFDSPSILLRRLDLVGCLRGSGKRHSLRRFELRPDNLPGQSTVQLSELVQE